MPKKKYGQNFLINNELINQIISLEKIKNNNILEIGSGNLALTKKIYENKPKKFFSIEIDKDLVEKYKKHTLSTHIINEDALKINEFDFFNKENFSIISNLPFNISTHLLIKWLKMQNNYNCINSMTLMFQKELAERIVAKENSKKYGRISILSKAFFEIEKKLDIKKENFSPIPKVDAIVLKFTALKNNLIDKQDFPKLEKITLKFFNERRKKNIKKIKMFFNSDQIKNQGLEKYFSLRAENLCNKTYYKLAKIL